MRSVQEIEKDIAIVEAVNTLISMLKRTCEDVIEKLYDELEKAERKEENT